MTRLAPALLLAVAVSFTTRAATNSPALDLARQLNSAFVEVAESVSPSVVVIRVANKPGKLPFDDDEHPFWDLLPKGMPEEFRKYFKDDLEKRRKEEEEESRSAPPRFDGKGSGVIIQEDGYILTNFHVVEDATKIEVRLRDRRRFTATLHGKDPLSDLAVLKINATNLQAAKLGDSDAVRVGEFAIAIGAPFEFDY